MIGAIVAGVVAVAGTIASLIANGQRAEAEKLARQSFEGVEIPQDIQKLFGPTGLQPDVEASDMRATQVDALKRLAEIGNNGGLDPQALAGISQAQGEATRASRGRLGAINAQLNRQGASSAGNAALLRQQAAQDASNQAAQQGLDINAQAQQRALQALTQRSQIAGQARGQDESLGQSNQQARAVRDRFNAQLQAQGAQAQLSASQLALQKAAGLAGQDNKIAATQSDTGKIIGTGIADVGNAGLNAYEADQAEKERARKEALALAAKKPETRWA